MKTGYYGNARRSFWYLRFQNTGGLTHTTTRKGGVTIILIRYFLFSFDCWRNLGALLIRAFTDGVFLPRRACKTITWLVWKVILWEGPFLNPALFSFVNKFLANWRASLNHVFPQLIKSILIWQWKYSSPRFLFRERHYLIIYMVIKNMTFAGFFRISMIIESKNIL